MRHVAPAVRAGGAAGRWDGGAARRCRGPACGVDAGDWDLLPGAGVGRGADPVGGGGPRGRRGAGPECAAARAHAKARLTPAMRARAIRS